MVEFGRMLSYSASIMKKIALTLCSFLFALNSGISFASPTFDNLSCLTQSRIAKVRSKPSSNIGAVYKACNVELTQKTSPLNLNEQQRKIVFLSILANSMAPYGGSRSIRLEDLLSDKVMDCDNYAILTGYFNRIFLGESVHIKFYGVDGGAIGNHAQLFIGENGEQLLLDPTIGLVAKVGFNDLLMGKAVRNDQIRIFRQHNDSNIDFFAKKVLDALLNGKYRPSDLLYYFSSIDEYLEFSNEIAHLWESDTNALLRRFPTPGSLALRKNLAGQRRTK
jgi:hypothetical protein